MGLLKWNRGVHFLTDQKGIEIHSKQQRYHFHPSYWQKTKRSNATNINEYVGKQVFAHIPAEVQIMYSPFGKQTVSIY